jgi:hypothetical protein
MAERSGQMDVSAGSGGGEGEVPGDIRPEPSALSALDARRNTGASPQQAMAEAAPPHRSLSPGLHRMPKQPVWLWIPKLGEQVLIDSEHPLAATAAELPLQPEQSEEVAGGEWTDMSPTIVCTPGAQQP